MYAIIESAGRQYHVSPGDTVNVEKLSATVGEKVDFPVMACSSNQKSKSFCLGTPFVPQAKVTAIVTSHKKGPKILVFKKKRRQGYRRTQGHRQTYTTLFIQSISSKDGSEIADQDPKVLVPKKSVKKSKSRKK